MSYLTRGSGTRSRTLLLALFALALTALAMPALGAAAKKKKKDPEVTVMSRNLYLGADLGPAINAPDTCGAIDAGGEILNQVDRTNFPERAVLLAKEIAKADPDLVGLQEVALWRTQAVSDFSATPATEVRYDFLKLLQKQLKKAKAPYEVVVSQDEFDQELPADTDGSDATNEFACGADEDGRLTMRDVILKRADSDVKVGKTDAGQFVNTYNVVLGGVIPVSVDRGWVSAEVKVPSTKRTKAAKFKFVNSHLEAFGDPKIREAQAKELYAPQGDYDQGPLVTSKQLIFVGDINSGSAKDKIGAPNPGDPDDPLAYNALVNDFGMFNLGTRQTCCYPDPNLDSSTIGGYRFDHTVDHIMSKPKLKQLDSEVTGDNPKVKTPSGLVSSDHGGLWSTLKLKKPKK